MRQVAAAPIVVVGLCLAGSTGVAAQATSTLEGQVSDPQGGVLAGATVTLTLTSAESSPSVVITDTNGAYRFASLRPGVYTVRFDFPGFQTVEESVDLDGRAVRVLDAMLAISPFAQQVDVVGVTPGLGGGVDRSRIPSAVSVIGATELAERGASSVADTLQQRLGSVTLEGATGNPVQPTLRFRGFTASPLLGLPQGVAVYQNGVRINEPFGDIVQFDLIPQFAMESIELAAGAEPTFGLNALGGALALRLKNGFEASGFRGEAQGGSFERFSGTGEYGASRGPWALYLGANRFDEAGWRTASESGVTQAVADLGYRRGRVDAGGSFTFADSTLNGNGPAPIELLDVDRSAVFTFPDTTENRLAFGQGRVNILLSQAWSLQANGFYRRLDRQTLNGDEAEFSVCDDDVLPTGAPANTLCTGSGDDDDDDDDDPDDPTDEASQVVRLADDAADGGAPDDTASDASGATPLVDVVTGRFITDDDAAGNGAFNRSTTRSHGYGSSVQVTGTHQRGERANTVVVGAAVDLADVAFRSNSEVGTLTRDRTVAGSGLFVGVFEEAPDDLFNTSLETENRSFGVYFSDTVSFSDQWHVTVSGRFNDSQITIIDRLGTSLNGDHSFSRFNPAAGVVFRASDALSLVGRYTEASRAPTAAELSCADPQEPCRVPNAFVSDPPLEQAVARSVEGGARGRFSVHESDQEWSLVVYRTGIGDDILFVASPELLGTGFFQNAGDTRRVGLDAELSGRTDRFAWYASYGLIEATFESSLMLPSSPAANDAASENGEISVAPGDRLPGIPRHSFKLGGQYDVTTAWSIALDGIVASSRIFVGDEGNDQAPLDGYEVVNLRSAWALNDSLELFGRVDNLFDVHYDTFGVLAEVEIALEEAPDADDPRFVSPGTPRSAFVGARVRF